jgi:flagella basal body P-ring formation protein FlgA
MPRRRADGGRRTHGRAVLRALALGALLAGAPAAAAPARVASETLVGVARDWLVDRLGPEGEQARIELTAPPRDLLLPPGERSLRVRLQAGALTGGPVTLLVEALVTEPNGARTARSTTVGFRVNGEKPVVVAVRELTRRTIVAAADVRVERRPVERIPPGAVGDPREVIGKEVARPIAPGEAVAAAAITPVIAVRRGTAVTVLLDGPGFRIAARGIASEDGARGQAIRVINPSSRREMVGLVEDERTIRVPF